MTENRRSGVSFGDLQDKLEREAYPMSTDTLLEKHGERELTHANGAETLREIIEPMGHDTFDSVDEIQRAVLTMIGDEAEGRKDYTDREPNARGADFEQQSF